MNNDDLHDVCTDNVPIQNDAIVPTDELGHTFMYPKRIPKMKVEELAIKKYRTCVKGIDFSDVVTKFGCSKTKAQRILKDCCQRRMGKDLTLHTPILFRSPRRTSPQQYYPSAHRADIHEKLNQRGNVPIYPSGVSHFKHFPSTNPNEPLVMQSLEGYVLPWNCKH